MTTRNRKRKTTACAPTGRQQYLNSESASSTTSRFFGSLLDCWKQYSKAWSFISLSSSGSCHLGQSSWTWSQRRSKVEAFDADSAVSQLMANSRKHGSTAVSCVSAKRRSTTASDTERSMSLEKSEVTTRKACSSDGREA